MLPSSQTPSLEEEMSNSDKQPNVLAIPNLIGAAEGHILPSEILFHILSFIKAKDLRPNIVLASKQLEECCRYILSDSLKGKAMRFNAWHEDMLKKLLFELKYQDKNYEVTVLHQPQIEGGFVGFINSNQFKLFFRLGSISLAIAVGLFVKAAKALEIKASPDLLIGLGLSLVLAIVRYIATNHWEVPQQNADYQQSLLRNRDFMLIDRINARHHILDTLPSQPFNRSHIPARSTVAQLRTAFENTQNELTHIARQFSEVLEKEYLARPLAKTISFNDIPQPLQNYAKQISHMWKAAKRQDLIDGLSTDTIIDIADEKKTNLTYHRPGRNQNQEY